MTLISLDIDEIKKLSIPEKILFLEDLWNSIASHESEILVPDSHKVELDNREEFFSKSPGKLLSLNELQSNIEQRK